jgi:predicted AAA+ superfamily ATPase
MTNLQLHLSQRLTDAITRPFPALTPRDVVETQVPGKALAAIGVRRAGKTSFLWQCLAGRLAAGRARESLLLLGLEDDRLAGMQSADLDWLFEEWQRRHPGLRERGPVTLALDEIQVVPGWERFARRLMDTEHVELLLSGSSAKLLSREIATSMRGRALSVLVHPFSFRESLRHAAQEPSAPWEALGVAERSRVAHALRGYLVRGGYPEAQALEPRDRARLLTSYVDVVALRDVIERHNVSNPLALRWMIQQLLGNPAGAFSVQKLWHALRSSGLPVGKDTLHEYLAHLEDAFLVRTTALHARSPRKRMVAPRKAYPVDPGLIPLYATTGEPETGHALETVVLIELERRGYTVSWVKTAEGTEVDFHAYRPGERGLLVQVCATARELTTFAREVRALQHARAEHSDAEAVLLTLDETPPSEEMPRGVQWVPAGAWLLAGG